MTTTPVICRTDALARFGTALGEPVRARILVRLRQSPALPSDLADELGVSRQVVSNHLACLRGCGLVTVARDGRNAWYRLADPHLAHALDELLRVVLVVDPACCSGEACRCNLL